METFQKIAEAGSNIASMNASDFSDFYDDIFT